MSTTLNRQWPLTFEQKQSWKEAFIASVDSDAVCRLASRHNQSKPCQIFQESSSGSFNLCFFVEFPEDGTKWVVRIPIEPVIHNVWQKIQSEVATMKYIRAHTTIAVPRVHAFGQGGTADEENPTGLAYLIMDYVAGHPLDILPFTTNEITPERRDHFYSQLIDVLAQLRQQEFDHAGYLMPHPEGGPEPYVGNSLSIVLNQLETDKGPAKTPMARFDSAADFATYCYSLFVKVYDLPAPDMQAFTAEYEAFAVPELQKRLSEFLDPQRDRAPFVLAHTDLLAPNIVDDDLNIQGIIDQKQTGTVPQQFFLPPTQLGGLPPDWVARPHYQRAYGHFYRVLSEKAATSQICQQLAEEWGEDLPSKLDLSMAVTLQRDGYFLEMFYRGIFPKSHKWWDFAKTIREAVQHLIGEDCDGVLRKDVQRRLERSERYTEYLKEDGLYVPEDGTEN